MDFFVELRSVANTEYSTEGLLQDFFGVGDTEALIHTQPLPRVKTQQEVDRLNDFGVAPGFAWQTINENAPQRGHELDMPRLQHRRTMTVRLPRAQEWRHLLVNSRTPIDKLKALTLPVHGNEWLMGDLREPRG